MGNRYLIEKYDTDQRMLGGADPATRNKVRMWIHAAEGTFMIHALSITYARWFAPKAFQDQPSEMKEFEKGLAVNVGKDLDWLNGELKGRRFLAGDVSFTYLPTYLAGFVLGNLRWAELHLRICFFFSLSKLKTSGRC